VEADGKHVDEAADRLSETRIAPVGIDNPEADVFGVGMASKQDLQDSQV